MKTFFNRDLINKLIKNSATFISGIKRVSADFRALEISEKEIVVDTWFENDVINISSVAYELQKKIFFNLSQQLDDTSIKVNIVIHS